MKATQRDFIQVAKRAGRDCAIFFLCGPDEAGASSAATKVLASLDEPGDRIELSGAELKSDPVRLVDEARSISMFDDSRHIYARVSGDEAHDAVQTFLELSDIGETAGACPVIIVATSATDKSRTAKLLVKRPDALVAMFYPPDLRSITAEVRAMADAEGLRLGGDVAERIARGSGLDVRLARSEVDKLALYLDASPQSPKLADAEAHDAVGAKTEEDGFMLLVNAVLAGDLHRTPHELRRFQEMRLNAVGVVLALERRVAQLASLTAKMQPGEDINSLLDRHRVFFRDKRDINGQLRRWDRAKLARLITRLTTLHAALLSSGAAVDVVTGQGLADIARVAAHRRS